MARHIIINGDQESTTARDTVSTFLLNRFSLIPQFLLLTLAELVKDTREKVIKDLGKERVRKHNRWF
jgi:hypothetical protein